jgi:hypothetical protein
LMLDGVLEFLNDKSFDVHGLPLTEGVDPIELVAEVLSFT